PSSPISSRFPYTTLFRSLLRREPLCHLSLSLSNPASNGKRQPIQEVESLTIPCSYWRAPTAVNLACQVALAVSVAVQEPGMPLGDRKSTRLNSSHQIISY